MKTHTLLSTLAVLWFALLPATAAVALTGATAEDPAWRAWKADVFERVYANPRAVADEAGQRLARTDTPMDIRERLKATVEMAMAAQSLSRQAQHEARDWLEAGVAAALAAGPLHADLAVDLLSLRAIDDAILGRYAAAERHLAQAGKVVDGLRDPAQTWPLLFARGVVSMASGDGAKATEQFEQALQRTSSPLQRAVNLVWKAMSLRRFANPVSGMLRSSLDLLQEAHDIAYPGDYPVFHLLVLYAQIQSEVALGDFSKGGEHTREASMLNERLAPQGYEHPETAGGAIVAQFRREDVILAERLQAQRSLLVWSVGLVGLVICVAITVLLLHVRQRRRLQGLSDELQSRNVELQELARSRARLLAAACHDLRQPAHALGLSAELAMLARAQGDLPEGHQEVQRRLQSIRQNSITLTDMLGELMDQTRLSGGNYEADVGPVPLGELLDEVRLQFNDLARRKGLSLQVEGSKHSVVSDRHLLRRICFNLVSNAIKYTERGEVTVTTEALPPNRIQLVVRDTGPGIAPPDLPRVFSDYVRLDGGKGQEGLGIGLSIVKRAADLLGHALDFASQPGVGTTVSLTLEDAGSASALQLPSRSDSLPGADQLVAILEDDAESRQALTALLRQWGFATVVASSAAELADRLEALGRPRPDLLLTDLHLGTLDGLEQASMIRRWPGFERLPALLITGDLDPKIAERAQGMNIPVGHKPIVPRRLLVLIQSMLATAEQATPS